MDLQSLLFDFVDSYIHLFYCYFFFQLLNLQWVYEEFFRDFPLEKVFEQ